MTRINLHIAQPEKSAAFFRALSVPVRLCMIQAIGGKTGINISELAAKFSLPLSTAASHVRVLEKAGIIVVQEKPGLRGAQKTCAMMLQDLYMDFNPHWKDGKRFREIKSSMPLGNYFDCKITRPCGIAGRRAVIGIENFENGFYSPNRVHAQLIWFSAGYIEYRFPNHSFKEKNVREITFSFEACSETAGYNNDWPSDITLWINHKEVFTFRSTGDFGGKRGTYTPRWWPEVSTQYGELHAVKITPQGCYGDGRKTSEYTLESLGVNDDEFVSLKIGVKEDAECQGGLNLFGEYFGNYPQNIEMLAKVEN
jgi:predicted transcriptional regulator